MSNFKPKFKGRCKLYLNDVTPEALAKRVEHYGEWRTRRGDIFCKPRKFKAVIYPVSSEGQRLDELVVEFKSTGTDWHLSQAIHTQAVAYFDELLDTFADLKIDTTNSYAVVTV